MSNPSFPVKSRPLFVTSNIGGKTNQVMGASLVLDDTSAGFLPNRLTTTQRDAIPNPPVSLLIYNTTNARYEFYTGTAWDAMSNGNESGSMTGAQITSALDTYLGGSSWRGNLTAQQISDSLDTLFGSALWRSQMTGAAIRDALDTALGSAQWRSPMTGSDIVASIDNQLSTTTWRTGLTGQQISDKLDALLSGSGWRIVLTGQNISDMLDSLFGNTNWRTGGGGSMTGADIESALDSYFGNTAWRAGGYPSGIVYKYSTSATAAGLGVQTFGFTGNADTFFVRKIDANSDDFTAYHTDTPSGTTVYIVGSDGVHLKGTITSAATVASNTVSWAFTLVNLTGAFVAGSSYSFIFERPASGGSIDGATITSELDDYLNGAQNWRTLTYSNSVATRTGLTLTDISDMTLVQDSNIDDGSLSLTMPFDMIWGGINYGTDGVYYGSDGYITFGAGSNEYDSQGTPASIMAVPAIMIASADNSLQRLYTKTVVNGNQTVWHVRFEGTDSTSGPAGSPNMVWEAIFYSDIPNRVDLIMGVNARSSEQVTGTYGIVANAEWVVKSETPWVEGDQFSLFFEHAPHNNYVPNTHYNVLDVIKNTIGIDATDFHWSFSEEDKTSFVQDTNSLGTVNAFADGTVYTQRPSPFDDGLGGAFIANSNSSICIPYDETIWPLKNSAQMSLMFGYNFSGPGNVIVQLFNANATVWKVEINQNHVIATLFDTNGTPMSIVESPESEVIIPSRGVLVFRVAANLDMFLTINDQTFFASGKTNKGITAGTIIPAITQIATPSYDKGLDKNLSIIFTSEQATVAHFFLSDAIWNDYDVRSLVHGLGFGVGDYRFLDSRAPVYVMPGAQTNFLIELYRYIPVPTVYYPLSERDNAFQNQDQSGSSMPLVVNGGGQLFQGIPNFIADGGYCAELAGTQLTNQYYFADYFQLGSFTMGFCYQPTDSLDFAIHIAHTDADSTVYNRLSFTADNAGTTLINLYDNTGAPMNYVGVSTIFQPLQKTFVVISYDQPGNILTLYVNGKKFAGTPAGGGTMLSSSDFTSVATNDSIKFIGTGRIAHFFYVTSINNVTDSNVLALTSAILGTPLSFPAGGGGGIPDGPLTINAGTMTDDTPAFVINQTWDNSSPPTGDGIKFGGIRYNLDNPAGRQFQSHLLEFWTNGGNGGQPNFFMDWDFQFGRNSPYALVGVNRRGDMWSFGAQDPGLGMGANQNGHQGFFVRSGEPFRIGFSQGDAADKDCVASFAMQSSSSPMLELLSGNHLFSDGGGAQNIGLGFVNYRPMTAPAAPDVGVCLYVDIADGVLKCIDSSGVIKVVNLT